MFFLIFAIIDIVSGILLMLSGPALKGSELVFWFALALLIKGFIMFVHQKFGKDSKMVPFGPILDFVVALALFGVSGGFTLPFYIALGLLMLGKGVFGFLGSATGGF